MHAPADYACPFCPIADGIESAASLTTPAEVIARGAEATAFVPSHQWPNNRGHVIVIPNRHFENLFDLPLELAAPLQELVRRSAVALKSAYRCGGISTRQHNEPAGNQDVWHFHIHVFPRYEGVGLYGSSRELVAKEERRRQAALLREALRAEPGVSGRA